MRHVSAAADRHKDVDLYIVIFEMIYSISSGANDFLPSLLYKILQPG